MELHEKKIHEKKISELEEYPDDCGCCGESQGGPVVYSLDLKQWAIAVVKELTKGYDYYIGEKGGYTGKNDNIVNFLIDRFELTEDDLNASS